MIVIDTHIWLWWMTNSPPLSASHRSILAARQQTGIAACAISCWEVALLQSRGRLSFTVDLATWIASALNRPGVILIPLTPQIAIESCNLPAPFHRDPADQIIVATARILNCPLITVDAHIVSYPHVQLAP